MTERFPPVYFYIPQSEPHFAELPRTIEEYWPQLMATPQRRPPSGKYNWTLQTYLYLKAGGINCQLTGTLPGNGIVVAHRDFLGESILPGPRILLVCLLGDREAPEMWVRGTGRHPYAQIHVVQNPQAPLVARPAPLWESHYIPYWPQPGLIPRDAARGDRFEHAAYFGRSYNLAPELQIPRWADRLADLGLAWRLMPDERWHDYREIDVVVAVRSFDRRGYEYKPPSKLFNAWQAGVPAVLGRESAYDSQRRSHLDYIEVASVEEALLALRRLRDEVPLRHAMVANGQMRAAELKPSCLVALWRSFLYDQAIPAHERWCTAPPSARHLFITRRRLAAYRSIASRKIRRARSWLSLRARLAALRPRSRINSSPTTLT